MATWHEEPATARRLREVEERQMSAIALIEEAAAESRRGANAEARKRMARARLQVAVANGLLNRAVWMGPTVEPRPVAA